MDLRIFYALLLTLMPITELRLGLPIAITYALDHGVSIILVFSLVVLLNILVIFFIFWFLDTLHHVLMNFSVYRKGFNMFLNRFQRKVNKFEKRYETIGFLALILLVAVPLPGTGAWTGSLLAWLFGLERKKSILSIAIGVIIAGILVLFGTLGFIKLVF